MYDIHVNHTHTLLHRHAHTQWTPLCCLIHTSASIYKNFEDIGVYGVLLVYSTYLAKLAVGTDFLIDHKAIKHTYNWFVFEKLHIIQEFIEGAENLYQFVPTVVHEILTS